MDAINQSAAADAARGIHADAYAGQRWVREVARRCVADMHSARPFRDTDIILDYNAGPGITLEEIFYLGGAGVPVVGRGALVIDVSADMVRRSRELATLRCPLKGVMCRELDAFGGRRDAAGERRGSDGAVLSSDFTSFVSMPPAIDVAYLSLVTEYLEWAQIRTLALALLERLSPGGLLAIYDWAEHYRYPPGVAAAHPGGIPKAMWCELAGVMADALERPADRMADPVAGRGPRAMFPPKPAFRARVRVDTFDVDAAGEQRVPSGDAVHCLLCVKVPVGRRERDDAVA